DALPPPITITRRKSERRKDKERIQTIPSRSFNELRTSERGSAASIDAPSAPTESRTRSASSLLFHPSPDNHTSWSVKASSPLAMFDLTLWRDRGRFACKERRVPFP